MVGFTVFVVNAASGFVHGNQFNPNLCLISMKNYSLTLVEKSIISHTTTTFFINVHIYNIE